MKKIFLFLYLLLMPILPIMAILKIKFDKDLLAQLEQNFLYQKDKPLKFHLGCGATHLSGYINIDYPPEDHTVQTTSGADIYGDITRLLLPSYSVDEIRSHHVFEHFDRSTALALLTKWHVWLKKGGVLVIETPDFWGCIKLLNTDISFKRKQVLLRHIFGSQEAFWALHYDGWYKEKFEHILQTLGYKIIKTQTYQYLDLANIIIEAQKVEEISIEELSRRSKLLLRDYMVNTVSSEEKMWEIWCHQYDQRLNL